MRTFRHGIAAALAATCALLGCGGGGGGEGGGIGGTGSQGTLRVAITDAPGCGYDAVNISIEKIRVNQSSGAVDGDAGWAEIDLNPARRIDLLTLTNGALAELGQTPLPAGHYTQMRLVLAANDASTPLANSVTPTGGSETPLTTPSAQQSGLKLDVDIDVQSDRVADVVLDFDACRSIVKRGNSGQYNLKPVIRVIPRVSDAGMRVVGFVEPSGMSAAAVSLQNAGVPVKETVADATGQFVLYPVPTGNYDLVISAAGRVTAVLTGVPVSATSYTTLNATGTPLSAPAAPAPRTVAGVVTPATATIRALQTLTGGPTVQTAWAAVDAVVGTFEFQLPTQAPVRASYAPGAASYAFAADTGSAGLYTVEAASAGSVRSATVDVRSPVSPLSFSFP